MSDEAITNVNGSEVRGNTAFYGGGLYNNDFLPGNQFGAYMSIRQSAVYGNTASDSGCPYQIIPSGNLCGAGGGIFNENGDLVVANTTVAQNYAGHVRRRHLQPAHQLRLRQRPAVQRDGVGQLRGA